jgi:hypothetical protein
MSDSNTSDLLTRANSQLELNNYSAAKDLFVSYASGTCPSPGVLINLSVSFAQEKIQAFRRLSSQYPTNLECRQFLQGCFASAGMAELAFEDASRAISEFPNEKHQFLLPALSAKSQNTQFRKRRTSAPTHGNGPDEEIIRRAADGFTVDGG